MANRELFQKIHDVISVRPDEHLQSTWEWGSGTCGTVRCVGGWAIHLTTGKPVYADGGSATLRPETVDLARHHGIPPNSGDQLIRALAQKLLGLDDDLAQRLFFYVPDEVARGVVRAFAEGRDRDAAPILYGW